MKRLLSILATMFFTVSSFAAKEETAAVYSLREIINPILELV